MSWQTLKKGIYFCSIGLGLTACSLFSNTSSEYEDVYYDGDDVFFCENDKNCSDYLVAHLSEENGFEETIFVEKKMPSKQPEVLPTKGEPVLSGDNLPLFNAAGVRYCPAKRRCTGERLPPQPCAQPMPTYYNNISADAAANAIELIHPFTRTKVLCYDQQPVGTATDCANIFRADGYVLVTDIPQLPAKYDLLKEGTYPTRRWRGGGEVVPRW